jgi:hypothetical protein
LDRNPTSVAPVRHDQRDAIKRRSLTIGEVVSMEGLQQELPVGSGISRED